MTIVKKTFMSSIKFITHETIQGYKLGCKINISIDHTLKTTINQLTNEVAIVQKTVINTITHFEQWPRWPGQTASGKRSTSTSLSLRGILSSTSFLPLSPSWDPFQPSVSLPLLPFCLHSHLPCLPFLPSSLLPCLPSCPANFPASSYSILLQSFACIWRWESHSCITWGSTKPSWQRQFEGPFNVFFPINLCPAQLCSEQRKRYGRPGRRLMVDTSDGHEPWWEKTEKLVLAWYKWIVYRTGSKCFWDYLGSYNQYYQPLHIKNKLSISKTELSISKTEESLWRQHLSNLGSCPRQIVLYI